jgi:hypothetical protein
MTMEQEATAIFAAQLSAFLDEAIAKTDALLAALPPRTRVVEAPPQADVPPSAPPEPAKPTRKRKKKAAEEQKDESAIAPDVVVEVTAPSVEQGQLSPLPVESAEQLVPPLVSGHVGMAPDVLDQVGDPGQPSLAPAAERLSPDGGEDVTAAGSEALFQPVAEQAVW